MLKPAILAVAIAFAVLAAMPPNEASGAARVPETGRPAEKTPFPEIKDWDSLVITLDRTMCFGTCPDYRVEIRGDGSVTYEGRHYVEATGTRSAKIPVEAVHALFEKFRDAEFFWSHDAYEAEVTDMPTYTVTIAFDKTSKTIRDYAGSMAGMPEAFTEIETAIDETANTAQWIGSGEEPAQ